MARRRMISQELIIDEDFNALSISGQNVFTRLLVVSDDYGVIPANVYTLNKLINTPPRINLESALKEILASRLVFALEHEGRQFYMFKRGRFDEYQSYLIQKRTKSEYLRLSKEDIESKKFQEFLRNYFDLGSSPIESKEYKVLSIKKKEEREIPPLKEPVTEYFIEIKGTVEDAQAWWDHFEARDWKFKGGDKMKDWKASCRTWMRNKHKYEVSDGTTSKYYGKNRRVTKTDLDQSLAVAESLDRQEGKVH